MDKPKTTPRDFFLWAGAIIAFYGSIASFITLFFDYLNYTFPDPLSYYSNDPYSSGISYEMASLIVLIPVFLVLMYFIRRSIARDATRREVWVRRWAIFFTLFLAGALIVGDMITLLMYFFNGDVSMRFVLKVVLLLLVAAGVFMHFLADQWGYWDQYPKRAQSVGAVTALLALLTIIAGFFIVGTPWQARLYRFDEEKVSDLQQIQSQIINYWQSKEALPASLADLTDSVGGFFVPNDPQTGAAYLYRVTGKNTFDLCATFNAETQIDSIQSRGYSIPTVVPNDTDQARNSWYHPALSDKTAGVYCFHRTIDPELYPPFVKATAPRAQ